MAKENPSTENCSVATQLSRSSFSSHSVNGRSVRVVSAMVTPFRGMRADRIPGWQRGS
jgi:hypothetical protein